MKKDKNKQKSCQTLPTQNVRLIIINSNGNENRQNNLAPNGGKQQ